MPKVSVILTTHNGRKERCERAIWSVLDQTYTDFELIVVDDGSHDGTSAMVKSFTDKRLVYIKREKCFGNDTRPKNEGILASKGEYVAFLDSDNTYKQNHLEVLVSVLDKNPKIALSYGQRWVTVDGKPVGIGTTGVYNPSRLMVENYIDTSDVLVRREALMFVGGFDENQKKYIDWNVWVRLAKAGFDFELVPQIITDYHITNDSKSKKVLTEAEKKHLKDTGTFINIPDWDAINCFIHCTWLNTAHRPKVAIFTLTHDRRKLTEEAFESLQLHAGYDYDHFIVDNGSLDDTPQFLTEYCKYPRRYKILNSDNKGISIASNQAVELIKKMGNYDIIMKVDNDCIFETKNFLYEMVKIWERNHRIALSCYINGLKDSPGGAPRVAYGEIDGKMLGMSEHLGGICHFVDARAYDDWKWDENSFLHGIQDMEFSRHLTLNGYQMAYLESFYASHGHSTIEQQEKYKEYFERRSREKTTRYEPKQ